MRALHIICGAVFAAVYVAVAVAKPEADVRSDSDLRRALFKHYDKKVRPVASAADTIPVRVALVPLGITDVDVKDKIVTLDTYFYIKWQDHFPTWEPALYEGLTELVISPEEVWIPDLAVFLSTPDTNHFPTVRSNVIIFSNGTVLWTPPFTVRSRCPATADQVTKETFQCTISVGSWMHDGNLLDIKEHFKDVWQFARVKTFQDTNRDWTVESMTARTEMAHYERPEGYPTVRFDLKLRKHH